MFDEVIAKQLEKLTLEYREFVQGDFIEETSSFYSEAYNLDAEKKAMLSDRLALYFLFIVTKADLIKSISGDCGLDEQTVIYIVESIHESLPEPLSKSIELALKNNAPSNSLTEGVKNLDADVVTKEPIPPAGVNELTIKEKKVEATGKEVQLKNKLKEELKKKKEREAKGIRTMKDDVDKLRGNESPGKTSIPPAPASSFTKPFKGS